jgi:hypothetical protein
MGINCTKFVGYKKRTFKRADNVIEAREKAYKDMLSQRKKEKEQKKTEADGSDSVDIESLD